MFNLPERWLHRRLQRTAREGAPRGVLLIAVGGIGDAFLLSVVLPRYLSLAGSDEPVTLLLRQDAAKAAFLLPPDIEVMSLDFGKVRESRAYRRAAFEQLHANHYRLVVSLDYLRHPLLDEALVLACQAAEAVAMEPRSWAKYDKQLGKNRRLYARLFDSGPDHLDKVVRWAHFANWLTDSTEPPPKIRFDAARIRSSGGRTGAEADIILLPFSAVAAKQSPVELYRRLLSELPKGISVVIAGAPDDLDRNPDYRSLLALPDVRFDDSTFEMLAPALAAARLVVAVDSAGMHLAVALGAPTLCLASAAYVGEIVPYAEDVCPDNVEFIYTPMDCQSCLGNCIHPAEAGMYPCVARLDPIEIVNRALSLLRSGAGQ